MMNKFENNNPQKEFDCVEMKNKAQAQIYEMTKDMTSEEKYAFWKEQEAKLQNQRKLEKAV